VTGACSAWDCIAAYIYFSQRGLLHGLHPALTAVTGTRCSMHEVLQRTDELLAGLLHVIQQPRCTQHTLLPPQREDYSLALMPVVYMIRPPQPVSNSPPPQAQ
jgi:hypothetical protein